MNKSEEEIRLCIRKFLFENYLFGYEENELEDDSSFLRLGVIDSTGILELVTLIEQEFHVEVLDHEIIPGNFDSIRCISRYVAFKLNMSVRG